VNSHRPAHRAGTHHQQPVKERVGWVLPVPASAPHAMHRSSVVLRLRLVHAHEWVGRAGAGEDRSRAGMRHDRRGYVLAGRACHRVDGPACALRGRQVSDRRRARRTRCGKGSRAMEANWCGDDGRPMMGCCHVRCLWRGNRGDGGSQIWCDGWPCWLGEGGPAGHAEYSNGALNKQFELG